MYDTVRKISATLFASILLCSICVKSDYVFPSDFKFGVASAAAQIEGGWNASDKGESIWDRFTHEHPELIVDHSNADVACDSYHQWKTDINILNEIGVNYYRFSLAWTRILPTGFSNHISADGVQYYNNLIDGLIEKGIEPMVTIYHWDLPETIQNLGGWTSLQTTEYYADYARIVFQLFGDRVKFWFTINEPNSICEGTYGNGDASLKDPSPGIGDYLCGKNLLIAHAKAYHMYKNEFQDKQGGKIGIVIDSNWAEPRTNSTEDIEATEREIEMMLGWWAHPIFSESGDYPEIMKSRIQNRSAAENFAESRLPPFTKEEIMYIRGTSDFFGINHYVTNLISNFEYPIGDPAYVKDKGILRYQDPNWKPNMRTVPSGFYKLLNRIRQEYNNPEIYVTENGFYDEGQLQDLDRIVYIKEFMQALLAAIQDGCNIKSYTVWSILDNMEWRNGYTEKFGLYQVDFNSPNRTRTPKASSHFYKEVIKTKKIPNDINKFLRMV